ADTDDGAADINVDFDPKPYAEASKNTLAQHIGAILAGEVMKLKLESDGESSETATLILSAAQIARVAHEVNRAYCQSIGDFTQPRWEDAPEWQTNSAIQGVAFHLRNPGVTPEQSHENWMEQKRAEGWTYGPEKDPEKKEHPC